MKFTSKMIKKAWAIRKEAAAKFGCKCSEISWSICLKMAKEEKVMTGSAKQISWATDIKKEALEGIEAGNLGFGFLKADKAVSIDWLKSNNDSKFWIDNRKINTMSDSKGSWLKRAQLAINGLA